MSLDKATQQLSRALDRLESTTMPVGKKFPLVDLTQLQIERIIVGNLATLCNMTDPELVKRVLRKFAGADEAFWQVICSPDERKVGQ
jgi:hypothetical protein